MATTPLTTYSYGRSYYDREERESYGFDSVTSTTLNADHSVHHQVRQAYDNRTYAGSGDLLCSEARTGTGRLMARTTSEYTLGYPWRAPFAAASRPRPSRKRVPTICRATAAASCLAVRTTLMTNTGG